MTKKSTSKELIDALEVIKNLPPMKTGEDLCMSLKDAEAVREGMLQQQADEIARLKEEVGRMKSALHLANMERNRLRDDLWAILDEWEDINSTFETIIGKCDEVLKD